MTKKIGVIRVRGKVRLAKKINHTLDLLRLYNKNYCVVLPDTSQYIGMLRRVKDFITYGEIEEELFEDLISKRGQE